MRTYRQSVNLKLGLIIFAVLIAVASLWYTRRLVHQLGEREETIIQLWAGALATLPEAARQQTLNPYQSELRGLGDYLRRLQVGTDSLDEARLEAFKEAVAWAQSMPPSSELNFITNQIIVSDPFDIPAIVSEADSQTPQAWRNVPVPGPDSVARLPRERAQRILERLRTLQQEMDEEHEPLAIDLSFSDTSEARLQQLVHYGESPLVRELRFFPYVQLLFVGLFILVGYLGFSYVRRSEQSSLWVGMAKEAAHQLGTPISSLMGWTELLRLSDLSPEQETEALDEVEKDIDRLHRVANRFSDIGSTPRLEAQPLAPLLKATTDYIRRRIPKKGSQIVLEVTGADEIHAPVNAELFEWVLENLLKNALDAIEAVEGRIEVTAQRDGRYVHIDVSDTGKGVERRQWRNVFRPGYSTKKRGWGLGLSLAKRIVEDYHGGRLTIQHSKVGEGTTFRIELPAAL